MKYHKPTPRQRAIQNVVIPILLSLIILLNLDLGVTGANNTSRGIKIKLSNACTICRYTLCNPKFYDDSFPLLNLVPKRRAIRSRIITNQEYYKISAIRRLTANGRMPGIYSRIQPQGAIHDEISYNFFNLIGNWGAHRAAYPHCHLFNWMVNNPLRIRRYFREDARSGGPTRVRTKTVIFLASYLPQVGIPGRVRDFFKGPQDLHDFLRDNNWFGFSVCINGEIKHVEVSNQQSTGIGHSAKRCGLGSLLAYLCFRNVEHFEIQHAENVGRQYAGTALPRFQGYAIDANSRREDASTQSRGQIWTQGNLPEIRQGLMSQHCERLLYVYYGNIVSQARGFRTWGVGLNSPASHFNENKVFLAGAVAAGFTHIIVHNGGRQCHDRCCSKPAAKPGGKEQRTGHYGPANIFWIRGIYTEFNAVDPVPVSSKGSFGTAPHWKDQRIRPRGFVDHFGPQWYFCHPRAA